MRIFGMGIRLILSIIDGVVVWAIEKIYNLLISITNLTVFSDKLVDVIGKRISILIGVFFLFRAAFAMVEYIVTPDKLSDNKTGASKIVVNVVVSLGLLLTYNFIFHQAYILQGKIVGVDTGVSCDSTNGNQDCDKSTPSTGILQRIIFGVGNTNTTANVKSAGQLMTYAMYTSFIYPNPDVVGDACENVYNATSNVLAVDSASKCSQALSDAGVESDAFFEAVHEHQASYLLDSDILTAQKGIHFVFEYKLILSTICGVLVFIILVNFCIDVAIRMVKLGFLQVIAPIPILSYMIPNQKNMLSKWASACGKAYVDLFIRLTALYFAIFVIMAVLNTGIYDVTTGHKVGFGANPLGEILIILGALIFAQQLPKLISEITGINLEGSFSLNPMKKIGQSSLASAAVGFVGGGVAGLAANAYSNVQRRRLLENTPRSEWSDEEKNFMQHPRLRGLFSSFGGLGSGASRGLISGLQGGGKGSAFDAIKKGLSGSNQARTNRQAIRESNFIDKDNPYTFAQRNIIDPINRAAGYKNKDAGIGEIDKRIKKLTREMANLDMSEEGARREKEGFLGSSVFGEREFKNMQTYLSQEAALNRKVSSGASLTDDEKKALASLNKYHSNTAEYNSEKDQYDKLQERIDDLDAQYEEKRKEKSRLEDVQTARTAAEKNK